MTDKERLAAYPEMGAAFWIVLGVVLGAAEAVVVFVLFWVPRG